MSLSTSPWDGGKRFAESSRVGTAPLDQVGDAGAAERADRRVHRKAARATREFRIPIQLIARTVGIGVDQVAGADAHRGLVSFRVSAERDPGVIRNVEPLVSVGRPRVRAIGPGDEVPQRRAGRGPQTKSAVDVQPRTRLVRDVGDLLQRIDRARVHVAGLSADDPRSVVARERLAKRDGTIRPCASAATDTMRRRTEPEQP